MRDLRVWIYAAVTAVVPEIQKFFVVPGTNWIQLSCLQGCKQCVSEYQKADRPPDIKNYFVLFHIPPFVQLEWHFEIFKLCLL
jgi:hypothetical protein